MHDQNHIKFGYIYHWGAGLEVIGPVRVT